MRSLAPGTLTGINVRWGLAGIGARKPETHMRIVQRAAAIAGVIAIGPVAALAQTSAPVILPVDVAQTVNGVEVACTGIGADARQASEWATYPVRVEFSNARNEYLVGATVQLSDGTGRELLTVACDAPWVLLRLPEGRYRVTAHMLDAAAAPRSATFQAPDVGQLRVVLQFRDL